MSLKFNVSQLHSKSFSQNESFNAHPCEVSFIRLCALEKMKVVKNFEGLSYAREERG